MEEEGDLPEKVIKEECLTFEEDRTQAFYESSNYNYFLENCQPVKTEEKDPLGDIKPNTESDESQADKSQPTEEAGLNKPSSLLKTSPIAEDTFISTTLPQISYLDTEDENAHNKKGRTKNEQPRIKTEPTCTVSQDDLESQDVSTGSCSDTEAGRTPPCNNIRAASRDELLHCQECYRVYEGDCPKHGPLLIVEDTPVPVDINDKSRAKNSAPPQISVVESQALNPWSGVLAREFIHARTRFGPYEGQVVDPQSDAAHTWLVWKDGKPEHSIDASETGLSNWMRFVNIAKCGETYNLAAFQYKGGIYFKTVRNVVPGEELLVFNGDHGVDVTAFNTKEESGSVGLTRKTADGALTRTQKPRPTFKDEGADVSSYPFQIENDERTLLLTDGTALDREEKPLICSQCSVCFFQDSYVASRHQNHGRQDSLLGNEVESWPTQLRSANETEPFICGVCDKTTQCNKTFVKKINCKTQSTFACAQCNKAFRAESKLKEHLRTHSGEKPFACIRCNKAFSRSSNLNLHLRSHSGEKPFACTRCNKAFGRRSHLNVHLLVHSTDKPFACTECNKAFCKESKLNLHLRTHTGEKPFACTQCNKAFSRRSHLNMHLLVHSTDKPFACTECNKTFCAKSQLKEHLRTHSGNRPFMCTQCDKAFNRSSSLKTHLRWHSGEKPFACTECSKAFAEERFLKSHLRTHSDENPFACTLCDKIFAFNRDLSRHELTHSREKPFACTHCNKRFTQSENMKRHLTTHSEEKPFVCTQCNKGFRVKAALSAHLRGLSEDGPFVCSQCNKALCTKGQLNAHLRTHRGEKQLACTLCDETFAFNRDLSRHQLTHSREKPFACTHCNRRFAQSENMKRHLTICVLTM